MPRWIKIPLGTEIGLVQRDIVLHGHPAHLDSRTADGWMDQDATWLDGDPARPLSEGAQLPSPICRPCLLWPNGWMDQDATWYCGRPRPRRHCVRWTPSSPRKGHSSPPSFGACILQSSSRPSQLLMTTCLSYSKLFGESCHSFSLSYILLFGASVAGHPV